ncbi:MAG: DUF1080 domain-containing protein [Chloroflexi bacterium]|nr:DUF1080 domain-containing protein [Chloroflexota bacterium]
MTTRSRVKMTLLTIVLILSLTFSATAFAQDGDGSLFGDAGAYDVNARPLESHQMRARYVTVNAAMLFGADGKQLGKGALPEIKLNIFENANYTGRVTRAWTDRWGSYWTGKLNGVPGGYFFLTAVDGAFMAHVASTKGVYEVAYTPEGMYRAIQIDQSKFVDHDPAATFEASGAIPSEDALGPSADSGARIDILVAYTDDARAAAGSTAAMKALILTALNETNAAYANSGVTTRLRLVHVEEYSYAETGNMSTDLSRFRGTADGYMDAVHTLRNTYAADMLGLIVANGGSYCGLASTIMATDTTAFQITDNGCATGYYSFAHEFAHLQGARHDTYVDPSNTPYSYGHGYVHTGADAYNRWRTIMAYNDKCSSLGYSCTRVQYFSNPAKTYHGAATGTASTKNYLVLNNTDTTVASFRTEIIGEDFYSSFAGSSAGWSSVTGSWALAGGTYFQSSGLANTGASTKHTNTHGDVTFEVRMKRTGSCTSCANRIIIRGTPTSLVSTNWWKPSYVFQYGNNGQFSIYEVTSAGSTVALKAWTAHGAIVANNWNTLKVVAVGSSLKFYINGTLVWTVTDSSLKVGKVGFGFYRDPAAGTLQVDWASAYNTPTADFDPNEQVVPGVEIGGGSMDMSQ